MMTPETLRIETIRNDIAQLRRLQGDVISVFADGPVPDRCQVGLRIRTIIGPGPTYRSQHEVEVAFGSGYPSRRPEIRMTTTPAPFHPNWYADGGWCSGTWNMEESLQNLVIRMIRTLRFEEGYTNPDSPANSDASNWYRLNRDNGLFPCDCTPLPVPNVVVIDRDRRVVLDAPRLQLHSDCEGG